MKKINLLFLIILIMFNLVPHSACAEMQPITFQNKKNSYRHIEKGDIKSGEVDFRTYMRKLQKKIEKNWHPPRDVGYRAVGLRFKIAKDGSLLHFMINKSSGSEDVDKAAILAVQNSTPFAPLPLECKSKSITIEFSLKCNEEDINMRTYLNELEKRIRKNWKPSSDLILQKIVLLLEISRDGRLLYTRVRESSGSKKADKAAILAAKRTAPFRPLPAVYKGDKIQIEFTLASKANFEDDKPVIFKYPFSSYYHLLQNLIK